MSSATASPVSHNPGPLNLNYDSEDDMQIDSDADHSNPKEPDADADGESVDEDVSPPPIVMPVDSHVAALSLSHRHSDSVCVLTIFSMFIISLFVIIAGC